LLLKGSRWSEVHLAGGGVSESTRHRRSAEVSGCDCISIDGQALYLAHLWYGRHVAYQTGTTYLGELWANESDPLSETIFNGLWGFVKHGAGAVGAMREVQNSCEQLIGLAH